MRIPKSLIIGSTILLISCGENVKKVAFQPLSLPPPMPASMVLSQADVECLSDAALDKVIILDKRRKTLREIIKSTQQ